MTTIERPDHSASQFTQINDAANSAAGAARDGDLRLEPDAAANAAKASALLLHSLQAAKRNIDRISQIPGLNGYDSDRRLRTERLEKKAHGGPGSLEKILDEHIASITALRDLYIAAGKAYQDTDFDGKKHFDAIDFNNLTVQTVDPTTGQPSGNFIPVVAPAPSGS
ncbi:hypothetical protein [Gordonia soli]|uniref:Uncharacterized protein n=1 Tax=Gordonia soli NBRC 108243 TaxID=1223545 RepID=M0QPK0_9ACTN|nr:hypothetical protein [Gordonia soli]GAC69347.1 hypothetical protein GS4_23_01440 [Gordonia soli NBRC 108243]